MGDYIKREDAIEQARRNWTGEGDWIASTEINLLKNLPSVDVVEVVRCENCRYWQNYNDVMVCGLTNAMMSVSDFCSYGERADT